MQIIKKISLYILGIGLLLIGNRKFLQDLFHSSENKEDENKAQQNVSFDVMRLTYHPENDSLSSQQPYFQIMRYDPTQANASTHVESDHAETATASS